MTEQQTFNKVVAHLRKQGKKAERDGKCLYRLKTEEGVLMCAAGCLIPDEKYDENMEDDAIFSNGDNLTCEVLREEGHDLELVGWLQAIHDSYPTEAWERQFKVVAEELELTIPA